MSGANSDDDPLRLGRRMRLLATVQALLADPSIAGLKDAPKLAAVVLYAKSRAPRGKKSDNQTSISGGDWSGPASWAAVVASRSRSSKIGRRSASRPTRPGGVASVRVVAGAADPRCSAAELGCWATAADFREGHR
ncbi:MULTISPECIES: hypothetical protein [unclassified Streptomyces]|uniref:hypothetical protein n=1 Tax=unclassified Streptomyces TaxID=2593676 RepID=UPI000F4ADB56|nr:MULTISPECIES: hypothetical protein [unclassified Streptomyces]MCX4774474.1 hypothetical protein [Streptomyces sp. NBC_01285]